MENMKEVSAEESAAAIEEFSEAVGRVIASADISEVLGFITGVFVSLTVELVKREGHDADKEIKVDGGKSRDITIHAQKV